MSRSKVSRYHFYRKLPNKMQLKGPCEWPKKSDLEFIFLIIKNSKLKEFQDFVV